jgi:glycosyltransferase involved in cell wall biosynthesis
MPGPELLERTAPQPMDRRRRQGPLIIDARMLFASGIGRYLREILIRRPAHLEGDLHFIHNSPAQKEWIREYFPSADLINSRAGIYSWREQGLARALPSQASLWIPHYNVPLLGRCRVIATVHDIAPLAIPHLFGGPLKHLAARFYFASVRRRASRIITVSHFTRAELMAHGIADARRISVIPNGVGSYWFEGSAKETRGNRLLFVGNLKPHKNLERLVDVVEMARRHLPLELVVVGRFAGFRSGISGRLLDFMRTTAWIRLLGEVSDSELRAQYHEAAALVFPSMYEGFGLPVLEALAASCPVVCSAIPALQEIAGPPRESGGVVDYFDPTSSVDMAAVILRRLTLEAAEREKLVTAGRKAAAAFLWDKTAQATWEVLQEDTPR